MVMDNKNSTQTALPFDLAGKDIRPYVRQHWNITFSRQKKVSVLSKKIMARVISEIKRDDSDFKPVYRFHVTDFCGPEQDKSSVYKEVKKSFDELTDIKWLIEDLENEKLAYRHLLNTSDINCGYDKGFLTISLNPILKPYFIALSHYTIYELKWYMTFKSWYSTRLYELLSAFKDKGVWYVNIEEYRKLMDCEKKYKGNDTMMIEKTTEKAVVELENTDCAFTYEAVKAKSMVATGRKSIVGVEFRLKTITMKDIPQEWYKNEAHAKLLSRMQTRYHLSEANIVKYANAIGLKEVSKLLGTWDIKEASAEPIANKLHYCNKVFVAMGKKALENE